MGYGAYGREGEAVNPSRVMAHRSAKRKVLRATPLAAGLSSILELEVIALVFLSPFKSQERVEKAFCCNDTH